MATLKGTVKPVLILYVVPFIYSVGLAKFTKLERFLSFCISISMFTYSVSKLILSVVLKVQFFLVGIILFTVLLFRQIKRKNEKPF